jgi:hypothetical protein
VGPGDNVGTAKASLLVAMATSLRVTSTAPAKVPGLQLNTNEYTYSVRPNFKIRAFLKTKNDPETQKHNGVPYNGAPYFFQMVSQNHTAAPSGAQTSATRFAATLVSK